MDPICTELLQTQFNSTSILRTKTRIYPQSTRANFLLLPVACLLESEHSGVQISDSSAASRGDMHLPFLLKSHGQKRGAFRHGFVHHMCQRMASKP